MTPNSEGSALSKEGRTGKGEATAACPRRALEGGRQDGEGRPTQETTEREDGGESEGGKER